MNRQDGNREPSRSLGGRAAGTTLAIDLGTTNIVAAVDGLALPFACESGRSTLPSALAFLPTGEIEVGTAAKRRRSMDPENSIFSAKRIIGRGWSDPETEEFRRCYPMKLVDRDGEPAFETRAGLFSATDVAAKLLGTVREQVASETRFEKTVITVPPPFTAAQCTATLAAAESIGWHNVRLIDEPVAAAHAFAASSNSVARAGIFDLGGGTFDFSIVEWNGGRPKMICSETDPTVGGDEVDQLLAAWVAGRVLEEFNWDLRSYAEIHSRLILECERAKIRVGFFDGAKVDLAKVDPDGPAGSHQQEITRDVLGGLSDQLVRRTFATCDRVLRRAGTRPDELDAIFLSGGSTKLARVREGVEAYFGQPGRFEIEPTEVVAIGASLMPD